MLWYSLGTRQCPPSHNHTGPRSGDAGSLKHTCGHTPWFPLTPDIHTDVSEGTGSKGLLCRIQVLRKGRTLTTPTLFTEGVEC